MQSLKFFVFYYAGALVNAFGAIVLGAPIGVKYVTYVN